MQYQRALDEVDTKEMVAEETEDEQPTGLMARRK